MAEGDAGEIPAESTEEEALARLQEELKQVKVADVLVQTVLTISSLGYGRLAEDGRDLEQARLAIEALRALVPVLKGAIPDQTMRDFEQLVANMQLSYAGTVGAG